MTAPIRLPAVLFPVVAAAAALLLTGCLQVATPRSTADTDTDTDGDTDTSETVEPTETDVDDDGETVDVFTISVGDCLNDATGDGTVTETTVVDCAASHTAEVFASSTVDDGDFPGEDAIGAQAETDCIGDVFTSFVGVAYDDSELLVNYFVPTEGSWEAGDREILCLVADPSGTNTGTLAAANR